MRQINNIKCFYTTLTIWYMLIVILISFIMYIWFIEWQDIGRLERENYQIDNFRQEINKIH
ncbi:hypothetical protein DK853_54010, partial [Klebsiella oxytoca]